MAQVDFAVAFVVIFIMVSYSVFFVSNNLKQDFDHFNIMEMEETADSMVSQLFYSSDNNSLVTNLKKMEILFEEVGNYQHTENLVVSMGQVTDPGVYDLMMNEIPSSYANGNISFDLSFSENEKKYVNIIYGGSAENVSYNNNGNVTANILFEGDVPVLSQEKCDSLKSIPYDNSTDVFGVSNFRIDNYCVYGENPPEVANIIVRQIPMIIQDQNNSLYTDYVILMVW